MFLQLDKFIPSIILLIVFILITNLSFAQKNNPDEVLFYIDNEGYKSGEFRERFEFSPRLSKGKNPDSIKIEFLYSLIAEKLWAKEAAELLFDSELYVKTSTEYIKKMYLRDALYRNEIKNKVNVRQTEIEDAKQKLNKLLRLHYINSQSDSISLAIYNQLKKGLLFQTLCTQSNKIDTFCDTLTVSFGKMEKFVEDEVFKLKPGEFTVPIKTKIGFIIFSLDSLSINFPELQKPEEQINREVLRTLSERKEDSLSNKYYAEFFRNKIVNADVNLFNKLSEIIFQLGSEKKESDELTYLNDLEISRIINSLSDFEQESPYIKFEQNPVTLKRFILDIKHYQIGFKFKNIQNIKSILNAYNRDYIRDELLAREAYRMGYSNDPEVVKNLNNWRSYFLANYYMHTYNDSAAVSPEEVYNYFIKNLNDSLLTPKVKLTEINTKNLETMELVLEELNSKDFSEIADKYGAKDGMDGKSYLLLNELGSLIPAVNQMEANDLYGPFETEDGYSLIKLIDRKEEIEKLSDSFENVKDKIEEKLFYEKLENLLNEKSAELADKYNLKINTDLVKALNLSDLTMFVLRYMGFGGKISAVPLTKQFYFWSELLKQRRSEILP